MFSGIDNLGLFILAGVLLNLTPGPDVLYIMTRALKSGWRAGAVAALGITAGCFVHAGAAALGVSALLAASSTAFSILKWLGAAYLAWLGTKMLLAKPGAAPVLNITAGHYMRQALMITLLNPKAILFYMAFFPLFVDPTKQQGLATYGFMAATIAALTFLYGLTSTILTHFLAERIRANPMAARVLEKIAGLFLVGFGIKLAVSN